MMRKGEYYKGKLVEELKKLSTQDFMQLLSARQRRSLKREFTDQKKKLLKSLKIARETNQKKPVKTHCRDMIILPEMVGQQLLIYNGKEFLPLVISYEMIGRYLGEYSFTRKRVQHSAPGIGATKSSGSLSVK